MNKPQYLYRFCNAKRAIQILSEQSIYLAPANTMNDLFEFSVSPLGSYQPELGHFLCKLHWIVTGAAATDYEADELVRGASADQKRAEYDRLLTKLKDLSFHLKASGGLTCFSEHHLNQRMWAQYGDGHAGACIQFWDVDGRSAVHRDIQRVEYTNQADTSLIVNFFQDPERSIIEKLAEALFLKKTEDWRQENEWRIVRLPSEENRKQEIDRNFKFEETSVRRVFLGPNMTTENRKLIRAIRTPDLWGVYDLIPDVSLARMEYSGQELILSEADIDWWAGKNLKKVGG